MQRADSLEKTLMMGGIGGRRRRGWQRMRSLDGINWLDGHEFEWTLGVGDGPGALACCDSRCLKELDMTERLNWTDPRFVLAFHILSCVTLIKSLNLSFLIWTMGPMMVIPPSRLHVCLQRANDPDRAFWVPESGTNMNYSATWEKAIFCLEVMATIPKAKILIQAKLHLFWTLTQNSDWADASVFWAPIRAKDYWLRLLPSSALPVSLSFSTTSPLKSHCKESCKGSWSLLSFTVSSVTTSRCYGYLS